MNTTKLSIYIYKVITPKFNSCFSMSWQLYTALSKVVRELRVNSDHRLLLYLTRLRNARTVGENIFNSTLGKFLTFIMNTDKGRTLCILNDKYDQCHIISYLYIDF